MVETSGSNKIVNNTYFINFASAYCNMHKEPYKEQEPFYEIILVTLNRKRKEKRTLKVNIT